MTRISCSSCRGRQFYFDCPSIEHPINLCLERGKFLIRRQVDNEQVSKTLRNRTVLDHYIQDKTWSWTCTKCGESIDSDCKQWRALRKAALKYLK